MKSIDSYQPCREDYVYAYLNSPAVKAALHVEPSIYWEACSYSIQYSSVDSSVVSTVPIYKYLIDNKFGLNILIYSGDDDSVCGTIGKKFIYLSFSRST